MPHIGTKCFSRELDGRQKAALTADTTGIIVRHLDSKGSLIGVTPQQIRPEFWRTIWDAEIVPQMGALVEKPGYNM